MVHLLALAGRLGTDLSLKDWDRLGCNIPCLVNLMPSGDYLMEDFFYAGGLPAVIQELGDLIHQDAITVNGRTIGQNTENAPCYNRDVIRSLDNPLNRSGGLAVLEGNLCPQGAIIKPSAASPELMNHSGPALVFKNIEDLQNRINDPDLDVTPESIMVLQNCGPRGYPGMAEVGNMPLPPKLLKQGVKDMVRISDARMSGTAYGTVILHVAPEAAIGGTLALVENGDIIELSVETRSLNLNVSQNEITRRKNSWNPPKLPIDRGYGRLYLDHVLQADKGVDFDFLVGGSGAPVARDSHYFWRRLNVNQVAQNPVII